MKINIVLPWGKSGGINVVKKYTEYLIRQGHDVKLYRTVLPYNEKKIFTQNIKNIYLIIKYILLLLFIKKEKYEKYCLKVNNYNVKNADIIIATAWTTAFFVNKLKETKGKKVYFIQDYEIWDNEYLGKQSYILDFKKITISKWISKKIESQLNCKPLPIIYDGIDLERFNYKNRIYKNNYSDASFLMLYHKLPKKGIKNGISAFKKVKEMYPNVKLKMFGLEKKPDIPEYVEYFYNPSQDQLKKLYRDSDIFIFPSIEEGWGLTPLEAMASKCAVVATNTGCMLDIGKNMENVLISEPNDIDKMVENCIFLIQNKNAIKKISENAYNDVNELSWQKSYNAFEQFLIQIKNGG